MAPIYPMTWPVDSTDAFGVWWETLVGTWPAAAALTRRAAPTIILAILAGDKERSD